MINLYRKNKLLFFFIFISIWLVFASSAVNNVVTFSKRLNQIFSLLLYTPFMVLILWKFLSDLREFKTHIVNILYYVFIAYYAVLAGYRLLNDMEFKEGIYYTVVLLGSLSLFIQIRDGKANLSHLEIQNNLTAISLYIVAVKLLTVFLEGRVFGHAPINNLYSTSMLIMLLPFMITSYKEKTGIQAAIHWICFVCSVAMMLISSSRAITSLSAVVLFVLLCMQLHSGKAVIKFISGILCAVILVTALAALNVGLVRRSLYRTLGITWQISATPEDEIPSTTEPIPSTTEPIPSTTEHVEETAPSEGQNQTNTTAPSVPSEPQPVETIPTPTKSETERMQDYTDYQIAQSDAMRSTLFKLGLDEFKKSPIFGTGDLYYSYNLGYKTMEQTSHNFILESLVCYGIVGTALIALILILMLMQSGFFRGFLKNTIVPRLSLLLILIYFFAFGMVQPSVYNTLLCPLFGILLAYYGGEIWPDRTCVKSISVLKIGKGATNGTNK